VRVRLATATSNALAAVAAQHLAARVARRDLAVCVLAPSVPALGLEALPAKAISLVHGFLDLAKVDALQVPCDRAIITVYRTCSCGKGALN